MIRMILCLSLSLSVLCLPAAAATLFEEDVVVSAQFNSAFDDAGILSNADLVVGEVLTITANPDDLWSLEGGFNIFGNADGRGDIATYTIGAFSADVGALVGRVGDGDFFLVGTTFSKVIDETGQLRLYSWDRIPGDNGGFITARVTVTQPVIATVALPGSASALLLAVILLVGARRTLG